MKKYLMLISFACLIIASGTGMDWSPPKVEARAKMKTDSQLTAMSEKQGRDRMVIHFDRLRRHIDSINGINMIARDSFIQASTERDSFMLALIATISENSRLRASNEQYEKDMSFALKIPTVLFLLLIMIIASLIGQGLYRGFEKIREDKRQNV